MGLEGVGEETLLRRAENRMGSLEYNTLVHIARGLGGGVWHLYHSLFGGRDVRTKADDYMLSHVSLPKYTRRLLHNYDLWSTLSFHSRWTSPHQWISGWHLILGSIFGFSPFSLTMPPGRIDDAWKTLFANAGCVHDRIPSSFMHSNMWDTLLSEWCQFGVQRRKFSAGCCTVRILHGIKVVVLRHWPLSSFP